MWVGVRMRSEPLLLGNWMRCARVIAMGNLLVYWTSDFSPQAVDFERTKVRGPVYASVVQERSGNWCFHTLSASRISADLRVGLSSQMRGQPTGKKGSSSL